MTDMFEYVQNKYETPIPSIYLLDLDMAGISYVKKIQELVVSIYGMHHSALGMIVNRLYHDTVIQIVDIMDRPEENFFGDLATIPNFSRYEDLDHLFQFTETRRIFAQAMREFALNLFFKLRDILPDLHVKHVQLVSLTLMQIQIAVYNVNEV